MQHSFGCLLAGEDRAQRVTGRRVVTLPSFSSTRWRPQWGRSGIDHLYLSVFLLNSHGCQQGRIISECRPWRKTPTHVSRSRGEESCDSRSFDLTWGIVWGVGVGTRGPESAVPPPGPPQTARILSSEPTGVWDLHTRDPNCIGELDGGWGATDFLWLVTKVGFSQDRDDHPICWAFVLFLR